MVFNRPFPTSCDDKDVLDSRCYSLFNDVLNRWLIHDGQHLFGLSLCCRQEPSTQPSRGDNGFSNPLHSGPHSSLKYGCEDEVFASYANVFYTNTLSVARP